MKESFPNERSLIVTVGMCVKDSEKTIRKAVNSVFNQDFHHEHMELIVVDGMSHDQTLRIIMDRLSHGDLEARIFSENSGLGAARQIVVKEAKGNFIIWVDGDTILPKTYVRRQVAFMDEHPEVGFAAGEYSVYSSAHATYAGQRVAADLENIVYAVDSAYAKEDSLKRKKLPATEGTIFRATAIRQIGGFDERIHGAGEDTEVFYRMKRAGWEISFTKETFSESTRESWLDLWTQYVWYGRGGHYVLHKHPHAITLWKTSPVAGFLEGVLHCPMAYLLIHKKVVFLLPFHYAYKRLAWLYGFSRAHSEGYGHAAKN
ncbi:glycosyltransferase [Candidatus Bathyarchaeota archaeon]|nr:glycosyltransferase [Candidatus Bathyarchaeota archaeon]